LVGAFSVEDMINALESLPRRNIRLSDSQREVVNHEKGPLWIIAGPGSGKTEALVLRCLRLLLADRVDPHSVMITTFTEKAGRNLQDRLILYKEHIAAKFSSAKGVDLTQLRVGTLHSLCNDILLEYRFSGYRNFRPMDDMEQLLFIYFHSGLANMPSRLSTEQADLFKHFSYMFDRRSLNVMKSGRTPSRWARAGVAQSLFNRIVEYRLDLNSMTSKDGIWKTLTYEFMQYEDALKRNFRVDFAHMQSKLLDFLDTPRGDMFIHGGAKPQDLGLKHVLVDEYQDTNPIQAEIYFKLASREPHNLVVVGDDDQALYRFRGGTVESMITFDQMCKKHYGIKPKKADLVENHRSHEGIVKWCSDYIMSFRTMKQPGARVADKKPLIPKSKIQGNWPAVTLIVSESSAQLSEAFADAIEYFHNNKIIQDYSDCVLLIHSTRETKNWAGPYADALRNRGIPIYNPRSRQFLEAEEVKLVLGALLTVIDESEEYPLTPDWIKNQCIKWRHSYLNEVRHYPQLRKYVEKATETISKSAPGKFFPSNLQEVFYHIINHEPFVTWFEDLERGLRLGYLTSIIEAYASTPVAGHPGVSRGTLRASTQSAGELSWMWKLELYNALVTLLVQQGINDPEDKEVVYPRGKVPFMTVHQAKGLEFPVVFVARTDEEAEPGSQHIIEEETSQFRKSVTPASNVDQKAGEDLIRFYYVAYSRAQYALILLLNSSNINPGERPGQLIGLGGGDLNWLRSRVTVWEV
jgi:DNA helicase-2/ATP-dependent DNA helicase PcrA